ncbi:MAG: ComF family protein [bacterium]
MNRIAFTPIRRVWDLVADALWPSACIVCGSDQRLVDGEVCENCLGKVLQAEPRITIPPLTSLTVVYLYDDVMRTLIHRFKFGGKPRIASTLADLMIRRLEQINTTPKDVHLVPVPDHPTRRRERGYNPAELLAEELSGRWGMILHDGLLQRIHYGPHQSILSDDERRRMHHDTFRAKAPMEDEESTKLLLVDDVLHTGTTLKRAASALHRSGWQDVGALVLCG